MSDRKRTDKERLDWLERFRGTIYTPRHFPDWEFHPDPPGTDGSYGDTIRDAIDAAMDAEDPPR